MSWTYGVFELDVLALQMVACGNYGVVAIVFQKCIVHSWTRGVIIFLFFCAHTKWILFTLNLLFISLLVYYIKYYLLNFLRWLWTEFSTDLALECRKAEWKVFCFFQSITVLKVWIKKLHNLQGLDSFQCVYFLFSTY